MTGTLARLAVLSALPALAGAQYLAAPITLPRPPGAVVVASPAVSTGAANDLVVVVPELAADPRLAQSTVHPWRALFSALPFDYAAQAGATCLAGGLVDGDASGDFVWCRPDAAGVAIAFGSDPGVLMNRHEPWPGVPRALTAVHLLPKAGHELVSPIVPDAPAAGVGWIAALDPNPAGGGPVATWLADGMTPPERDGPRLHAVRVGTIARTDGVDDLLLPMRSAAFLLVNQGASALGAGGFTLVRVGDPSNPAGTLPAGVGTALDLEGGGALDVDGDGLPDVVFAAWDPAAGAGHLLWVKGRGDATAFGTEPWRDLARDRPDLALGAPARARPVTLPDGRGALAVWDRAAEEVVLLAAGTGGAGVAQRLAVPGEEVEDVLAADVVGSTAPDLVVVTNAMAAPDEAWIHVFADDADLPPVLAWADGSPGAAERGVDHPMAVAASDPDGAVASIAWTLGGPDGAVVGTGPRYVIPAATLCAAASPLRVSIRATDDLGVSTVLTAEVPVGLAAPVLAVAGASAPGGLALAPGGTRAVVEGRAPSACDRSVTFTWGGSLPADVTTAQEDGRATSRLAVTLPEAAYPELLGGAPEVTARVSDEDGATSPTAHLALAVDGSALTEVRHAADRAALDLGEVAVLTTTIRSRLGVALPRVRVVPRLEGLAPAGEAQVTGAEVLERSADGEVVLAALPPGGEVAVVQPVRAIAAGSASGVELRSAGGWPLSPAARPDAARGRAPGCGCSAGDASAWGLAGVILAVWRRRSRAGARPLT